MAHSLFLGGSLLDWLLGGLVGAKSHCSLGDFDGEIFLLGRIKLLKVGLRCNNADTEKCPNHRLKAQCRHTEAGVKYTICQLCFMLLAEMQRPFSFHFLRGSYLPNLNPPKDSDCF